MTSNQVTHPLLLMLTNLLMSIQMKSSFHVLSVIALLPCPKFTGLKSPYHGVLENHLIHHCLDIICRPLKEAAAHGALMNDSLGRIRLCFTPIITYIIDMPEATVIAGVGGKTSHLTLASHKHFCNKFQCPTRLAILTLSQLEFLTQELNPWDLKPYVKQCKTRYRLNGVHLPYWCDWMLPDGAVMEPSQFLTPNPSITGTKHFGTTTRNGASALLEMKR